MHWRLSGRENLGFKVDGSKSALSFVFLLDWCLKLISKLRTQNTSILIIATMSLSFKFPLRNRSSEAQITIPDNQNTRPICEHLGRNRFCGIFFSKKSVEQSVEYLMILFVFLPCKSFHLLMSDYSTNCCTYGNICTLFLLFFAPPSSTD